MPSAGDVVRASDTTRYYAKVTQQSVQSINSATYTAIQFDGTDDVDNLSIHDPVTNNTRLVIGLALGWWLVGGSYATGGSATASTHRARILLNGVAVNGAYSSTPAFSGTAMTGGFWGIMTQTMVASTASTDYVELYGYQDTGGAVNTTVSGDLRSHMWALYLGP